VDVAPPPSAPVVKYWRVPRDVERRNYDEKDWRVRTDGSRGPVRKVVRESGDPMPEVYRVLPLHHVIFTCEFQRLWRELNPELSDKKWSTLMGSGLAWMNDTGSPPHFNCITKEPVGVKTMPRFDQFRLNSLAKVTGTVTSDMLWLDTMLTSKPAMRAEDVLKIEHYWFYGTSVNVRGETNYIMRPGVDGAFHRVRIPVLASVPVFIPLNELIEIT
jgi:hypothetical protein